MKQIIYTIVLSYYRIPVAVSQDRSHLSENFIKSIVTIFTSEHKITEGSISKYEALGLEKIMHKLEKVIDLIKPI